MYLIEILHQTTTTFSIIRFALQLYLIEILHQTTTDWLLEDTPECCILSKFYIKPQLNRDYGDEANCCILSKFYIKPQLAFLRACAFRGCILSKFYIKPQLVILDVYEEYVVSYRNSTSNHNRCEVNCSNEKLYLIEILHQTTTVTSFLPFNQQLYLIEILHQTTTDLSFFSFYV